MWHSTKPHPQALQISLTCRSKEPMPNLSLKKTWTDTELTCRAGTTGRRVHTLYSVIQLCCGSKIKLTPLGPSTFLQAVCTPKRHLDTSCSFHVLPMQKIVIGCQGQIRVIMHCGGFLLEERPFWSYLKKYPDLVLSCQDLTFSIPYKFTMTKTLFNSLRIVILGLLPTVIRTTFLKLIF